MTNTDQAKQVQTFIRHMSTQSYGKKNMVKAKADTGTGSLGLYAEFVTRDTTGEPVRHSRYFVVGRHVYAASKTIGQTKAHWKVRDMANTVDALNVIEKMADRSNVEPFGTYVFVELAADDLATIESGQAPGARFRGQYRLERDFGKFDFEKVSPSRVVISKPLHDGAVKLARRLTGVV